MIGSIEGRSNPAAADSIVDAVVTNRLIIGETLLTSGTLDKLEEDHSALSARIGIPWQTVREGISILVYDGVAGGPDNFIAIRPVTHREYTDITGRQDSSEEMTLSRALIRAISSGNTDFVSALEERLQSYEDDIKESEGDDFLRRDGIFRRELEANLYSWACVGDWSDGKNQRGWGNRLRIFFSDQNQRLLETSVPLVDADQAAVIAQNHQVIFDRSKKKAVAVINRDLDIKLGWLREVEKSI